MTRLPTALAVMALLASPLTAQERPAAILVLDGSGSMWGQIDGTAKITIAQDVIGGLMTTLPADLDLGLTVYGHRRKGDCADIETLVMPGPDTRGAITGAVAAGLAYFSVGIPAIGTALFLSMVVTMAAAGLMGAAVPLLLKAVRLDPALGAGVIVTTFTDVFAFFSFLGIGTLLLDRLTG